MRTPASFSRAVSRAFSTTCNKKTFSSSTTTSRFAKSNINSSIGLTQNSCSHNYSTFLSSSSTQFQAITPSGCSNNHHSALQTMTQNGKRNNLPGFRNVRTTAMLSQVFALGSCVDDDDC
ncbi:hypothetical protein FDP41_006375 [Naegleria fowleri]|uniref:Uncharacterized protein n=1 Tax=Naegleria fowleri TaxID=5763 RepID=A0A6A5B7C6_NAEFO|nr:uncharacterized protein FDP41_006375 [Naegleria fowleri]KAF0974343.1 hypothetical protein FDP41_006375 [Naegleria fowleri]